MAADAPPTIDPVAAMRWHRRAPAHSPWLHEEVGRRMEDRLQWIKLAPRRWLDWEPVHGGIEAHRAVASRYADAGQLVVEKQPAHRDAARSALAASLWQRLRGRTPEFPEAAPDESVQMLWANMRLHMSAEPQALLAAWQKALTTDGFLMFSCLGPDTLRELRALYTDLGWPPPAHEFTDMHDWGDMLVQSGFAEPVMDMERLTLTFETPSRLLAELRELGCNLHIERHRGLRGRQWRSRLEHELTRSLAGEDGRLALTFEVIYGHAFKPAARMRVAPETAVDIQDMRRMLRKGEPR